MLWFSAKPLIDEDELDWLFAGLKWLMSEEGIEAASQIPALILPDRDHFPPSDLQGHERALELFGIVKSHCGMADWPAELVAGENDGSHEPVNTMGFVMTSNSALGTFSVERDGVPVIHYQPSLLRSPERLVATLVHELSHYRMHGYSSLPPGGLDLEELATDLLSVLMGFGIFLANGARNFTGHSSYDMQGWSSQRSGYLSEQALVTALAATERMAGREPLMTAGPLLKSYLRSDLKKADAHLRRNFPDLLAAVQGTDLDAYSS